MLRNHHVVAGMSARAVEDQDDLLGWTGAHRRREGRQLGREPVGADFRRHRPDTLAGGWVDTGDHVAPLVAWFDPWFDQGERTHAGQHPDPPHQRLEAWMPDAMLVGCPDLDLGGRESRGDCTAYAAERFLQATCSWALAAT